MWNKLLPVLNARNLGRYLVLGAVSLFIVYSFYDRDIIEQSEDAVQVRVAISQPVLFSNDTPITVLFWTDYHRTDPLRLLNKIEEKSGNGNSSYKSVRCPSLPECRFTRDKSLLDISDGVIFHARDLHFLSTE